MISFESETNVYLLIVTFSDPPIDPRGVLAQATINASWSSLRL